MTTQSQPRAGGEAAHKMTVIEGIPGVTQRVVYSYRGERIVRRYRTHDSRNKTHNGFWWEVFGTQHGTRAKAKAAIDVALAKEGGAK